MCTYAKHLNLYFSYSAYPTEFPTLLTTSSLHIYSSFCKHLRVGRAEGDHLSLAGAYSLFSIFGMGYTVILV